MYTTILSINTDIIEDMDLIMVTIQAIGFLAFGLITLSYWNKSKRNILLLQIVAYALYGLHFYLLNAYPGALCNIGGVATLMLIYYKDNLLKSEYKKHYQSWILGIILIIFGIIAYLSFDHTNPIISLLPIIASIVPLIALWQSDKQIARAAGIIGSICWFIYAIVSQSYATIISEIIFIVSTMFAIIRHRNKHK